MSTEIQNFEANSSSILKQVIKKDRKQTVHWSKQEEKKFIYYLFLVYKDFMKPGLNQRVIKHKYQKMAKFIKTRDPKQCRTHFNRMIREKKAVQNSLDYYLKVKLLEIRSFNENDSQLISKIDQYVRENPELSLEFSQKVKKIAENIKNIDQLDLKPSQGRIKILKNVQINPNQKNKAIMKFQRNKTNDDSVLFDEQEQKRLLSQGDDEIMPHLSQGDQDNDQFKIMS